MDEAAAYLTDIATTMTIAVAAWLAASIAVSALAAVPGTLGRHCDRLARSIAPTMLRRIVTASATSAIALMTAAGTAGASPFVDNDPTPTSTSTAATRPTGTLPNPAFRPVHEEITLIPPSTTPTTSAQAPAPTTPSETPTRLTPSPATTATDAPTPPHASSATAATAAETTPGTWLPSTPPRESRQSTLLTPPPRPSVAVGDRDTVVVKAGDTLWSLVAQHLGPQASNRQIAETWPRWYAANRHIIGDNPDLILAGQVLEVPA